MTDYEKQKEELEKTRDRLWKKETDYRELEEKYQKVVDRGKEVVEECAYYKEQALTKQEERDKKKEQEGIASAFWVNARQMLFVGRPPIEILETALNIIADLTGNHTTNGEVATRLYAAAGDPDAILLEIKHQRNRLEKMKASYVRKPTTNLKQAIDKTEREVIDLMASIEEKKEDVQEETA